MDANEMLPSKSLKDKGTEKPAEAAAPSVAASPGDGDRMARIENILASLAALQVQKSGQSDPLALQLAAILEKVSGSQAVTADLITQAQRQQMRPSNELSPGKSPFDPFGTLVWERPALRCEMHIPHRAEIETLTIEEVELLNLLVEAGTAPYVIRRTDASRVKITVTVDSDDMGKISRMRWSHDTAFRNEYFRTMPSLPDVLREMLRQTPPQIAKQAVTILTMEDWEAMEKAGQAPPSKAA